MPVRMTEEEWEQSDNPPGDGGFYCSSCHKRVGVEGQATFPETCRHCGASGPFLYSHEIEEPA